MRSNASQRVPPFRGYQDYRAAALPCQYRNGICRYLAFHDRGIIPLPADSGGSRVMLLMSETDVSMLWLTPFHRIKYKTVRSTMG